MGGKPSVRQAVVSIDRLVLNVYSKYSRIKVRLAARYGLTPPQTAVMVLLGKNGTMRVSDIAAAMHMVDSNVSGICTRLEKAGLVQRTRLADNRRVVEVALTEAAADKLARIRAEQIGFCRRMSRRISREDMADVERGLVKMNDLLDLMLLDDAPA